MNSELEQIRNRKCFFRKNGALAALVVLQLVLPESAAKAQPRGHTAAERHAVELALLYLTEGPESWWTDLDPDSPLAALGHEAAVAEIEVRAGSPAGAKWTLQTSGAEAAGSAVFTIEFPSGVDETLTLGFTNRGGGARLSTVRISAEPASPLLSSVETDPGFAAAAPPDSHWMGWPWALATIGALAFLWATRGSRRFAPIAQVATALTLGVALMHCAQEPSGVDSEIAGTSAGEASAFLELRSLSDLRRSLFDTDGPLVTAADGEEDWDGTDLDRVAMLWRAQRMLADEDLISATRLLVSLPDPGEVPLTEILRARLALYRLQDVETALGYERALEVGGENDGLLYESKQALDLFGFEGRTREVRRRLVAMGSRNADVYYDLAESAVLRRRIPEALDHFRIAWELRPVERGEVFRRPALTALLEDFGMRDLLQISAPEEPKLRCRTTAEQPLAVPSAVSTRLLGSLLVFETLEGELWVSGGCDLAPPGATVYDAGTWARQEETLLLAELPAIKQATRTSAAMAAPHLRRKIAETAEMLARRNRWSEILELTGALTDELARLPSAILRLRAEALGRAGRLEEARELLVSLAARNQKMGRVDPAILFQLAENLAAQEEFEIAVKVMAEALAQLPFDVGDLRLQQLRQEKLLAESFSSHRTRHFELHFPRRAQRAVAERMGEILEQEYKRLQAWIPLKSDKVTVVQLLPWDDFKTNWSGGIEIVGLFDGKIRLPFAEVRYFPPALVEVLAHELAHAMIDERTGGLAPKWFHEALAQHVQSDSPRLNPIEGLMLKKSLIAFPLLDDILNTFASPVLVSIAYDEAAWSMHFIEARFGRRSIHRLLDGFERGLGTEEALAEAIDRPLARFDRELWDWCINEAPAAWSHQAAGL